MIVNTAHCFTISYLIARKPRLTKDYLRKIYFKQLNFLLLILSQTDRQTEVVVNFVLQYVVLIKK